MQKLNLIIFLSLFVLGGGFCQSKMEKYQFNQPLIGVTDRWHQIQLPNELYSELNPQYTNLRVFGITQSQDTIEAPFLLETLKGEESIDDRPFSMLNTVNDDSNHYYTFEVDEISSINRISLSFEVPNFNWYCSLEGSQDQKEWFNILENYRLVSIKIKDTDYEFTTLNFPAASFSYYRLTIHSPKNPKLIHAYLRKTELKEPTYRDFALDFTRKEVENTKTTIIDIDLGRVLPVSFLNIQVENDYDFYRSIKIQSLTDSVNTAKGWVYNFHTVKKGILSSLSDHSFNFSSTLTNKLRVLIQNNDNEALDIGGIDARGYVSRLLVRFDKSADYFLVYGGKHWEAPNYDLRFNQQNIPQSMTAITLGPITQIQSKNSGSQTSFLDNPLLLWLVMGVIILILGWFSLKMIRQA